jgi:hypothetical protein
MAMTRAWSRSDEHGFVRCARFSCAGEVVAAPVARACAFGRRRLIASAGLVLLVALSASPDSRAQTAPPALLRPSLEGAALVAPRFRQGDLSGTPDTTGSVPAAGALALAEVDPFRDFSPPQPASAPRVVVSRLLPLADPTADGNRLYAPSLRREDMATGASTVLPRQRRANDGLFGAPSAGVMDGAGGLRCRVGDKTPGCLVRYAFNAAPPPATRGVVPTNLPAIPRRDAKPMPATLATKPPEPPAAMMEMDPYEPTGIKAGNFLFKPALEMSTGYDSNPARVPNGRGSPIVVFAPELLVRSQFDRHQLNADLRASYTDATSFQAISHPTVDAKVNGRYDVTNTTAINGEARYNLDADDPGTARFANRFVKLPLVSTVGGTVGVTQDFDRTQVSLKGSLDRVMFQNALLTDGMVVTNQDRNFTQAAGQARVSYTLTPEYKPFVSVSVDRRTHDLPVDIAGFRRDSTGVAVEAGMTFALGDKLTGDAAVGYLVRNYSDPRLPSAGGFIADATLAWQATKETTVQLEAKSQVTEITDPGTSGVFKRDLKAEVDYQFQPWLIGAFKTGYGQDLFPGTTPLRIDNRYFVGLGLLYKVSREFQLKGDVRQEWTRSNTFGNDLTATVLMLGGRVQY